MSQTPYAVIEAQGHQFRVAPEEEHVVPHLVAEPGSEVTFDRVLLVAKAKGVTVGRPTVEGARVTARVVGDARGPKITVGIFKRRSKSRRKVGFRSTLTRVRILEVRA